MGLTITVRGLDTLVANNRELQSGVNEMGRRILTKTVITGQNLARQRAPVDFGRLRNSLTHRVQGPRAQYGTNVSYAKPLDQPRTRDPHYRRGPFQGTPTAGWFSDTVPLVEKELVNTIIPQEVDRLVRRWSS